MYHIKGKGGKEISENCFINGVKRPNNTYFWVIDGLGVSLNFGVRKKSYQSGGELNRETLHFTYPELG